MRRNAGEYHDTHAKVLIFGPFESDAKISFMAIVSLGMMSGGPEFF
jgi:hypothetical protein